MDELEMVVNRRPSSMLCEIFIFSRNRNPKRGDVMNFYNFDEKGEIIETRKAWETGVSIEDIKPTFIMPEFIFRNFCAVFSDQSRQQGIEIKTETFTKGELQGTKKHLEDLRILLKLDKKK